MKQIILLTLVYSILILAQEENVAHEIKIIKNEIKDMKHYLHELKGLVDDQEREIKILTQQIYKQNQEMSLQNEKISQLSTTVERLNQNLLDQEEQIKTTEIKIDNIVNNTNIYVKKQSLLGFFQSLDPNRVSVLSMMANNYAFWIRDQE